MSADNYQSGRVKLQFSVRDTGIGISQKQQETLFQPFNQADLSTTRKDGGTGLGLAISKNLVELMDGDLWVDSQEGVGSTFYFNVTVGVQKGTVVTNQDELRQAIELLRGTKILLVEDNEINLELAVILLKSNGMDVTVAENGRKALSALKNKKFDSELMDCQMPIMDGYTATREIRSNPRWANLPILALTANAMVEDKDKTLAAGMNDHISKPINVADMFNCMAKWISPSDNQTAAVSAETVEN